MTGDGVAELIGEGNDVLPDVTFQIPLSLLTRLVQREEAAFREVVFTGDSEFGALLAALAREIEWDVEEDLSHVVGDIAAHRIVDSVKRTHEWRKDAGQRLVENVAEYLTEERRAFITRNDLETLALANETLRDDVARLEARLNARLEARLGKLTADARSN